MEAININANTDINVIIIPNNKKPIFICTYNANYETGTYETRVVNEQGKEIFKEYGIEEDTANV